MAMIFPGDQFFQGRDDDIYDVVAHMAPGVYLDVGAAAGKITARLARKASASRIISFEPFAGNIPHFKKNTSPFSNVTLIEKAVSNFNGNGKLFVGSQLTGDERGWEGYNGYSSSGMLISEDHPRWESSKSNPVPVCSVDAVVNEHVRFMKIDVQGGELGVLQGAARTIETKGIDVIYVEFEGQMEVLRLLDSLSYTLWDSGNYVYSYSEGRPEPETLSSGFKASTVSSGRKVYRGPLTRRPLEMEEYGHFVQTLGDWALQTDIVAVHKSVVSEFLEAVARRHRAL